MLNRRETLAAFGAVALSSPTGAQEKPLANAGEWQKLDATLEFVRKRNAEAPRKAFVTIRGGHFAVFMNPAELLKELGALLASAPR